VWKIFSCHWAGFASFIHYAQAESDLSRFPRKSPRSLGWPPFSTGGHSFRQPISWPRRPPPEIGVARKPSDRSAGKYQIRAGSNLTVQQPLAERYRTVRSSSCG
jgi:hypothetical protein